MLKRYCLLVGTALLFAGCTVSDDYYDRDVFIKTEGLELFGCQNTKDNLYVPTLQGNQFTIITNTRDYRSLVQGCPAAVDFRAFDLIIGQYWVESNTEDIKYIYKRNRWNEYTLFVEFLQNRGGRAKFVTYHALVPKLHPADPVFVETAESYAW